MRTSTSNQLTVLHLSDLHFGRDHRFSPSTTPAGDKASSKGITRLSQSLKSDLQQLAGHSGKIIVAITGDFTTTAEATEFKKAKEFIHDFIGAELA